MLKILALKKEQNLGIVLDSMEDKYRRITNFCVKNILRMFHYKVVCVFILAI